MGGGVQVLKEAVYELLKQVPRGKVTTYKLIAEKLGVKCYRAVGQALRANPNPVTVPCHRVVKSDGSLGGYKGCVEAAKEKEELLREEGVVVKNGMVQRFEEVLWRF